MADDYRVRPSVAARARLLQAVEAVPVVHVVDAGTLGEYAQLLLERGRPDADRQLPEVAVHLESGCSSCADDLGALVALLSEDDGPGPGGRSTGGPGPGGGPGGGPGLTEIGPGPGPRPTPEDRPDARPRTTLDSGFHVGSLPDPVLAEAEADRRRQLRIWRERLLIAAAAAVLLMGLSLIGMAYLSRGQPQETPRLELAPTGPAPRQTAPGQPGTAAPGAAGGQPSATGVAAPAGNACPPTHPLKGNRASMIYHAPGGFFYDATAPEICFAQPADAEAAGYRRSQR
ncbi:MAG: hypothetical protein IT306_21610 [Chloroflexi bacterium]|nr:hypothetical protein [Chloroflexota bacterium]